MQVNKELHTCTSWYAYAAMFGSSIIFHSTNSGPSYLQLANFCNVPLLLSRILPAKTSSLHTTLHWGFGSLVSTSSLHDAGTPVANLL